MSDTERAADFINAIGVNVNMSYNVSSYANSSMVIASLNYLGIDHVRDADIGTFITESSWYTNQYESLAKAGIKYDFL